ATGRRLGDPALAHPGRAVGEQQGRDAQPRDRRYRPELGTGPDPVQLADLLVQRQLGNERHRLVMRGRCPRGREARDRDRRGDRGRGTENQGRAYRCHGFSVSTVALPAGRLTVRVFPLTDTGVESTPAKVPPFPTEWPPSRMPEVAFRAGAVS